MSRHRGWVFVWNNYTEANWEMLKLWDCRYLIMGKEIAPTTGTPHIQGYVYFDNARTKGSMNKKLNKNWNEGAKGTAWQNHAYSTKDGEFFEKGEKPRQGKRVDLIKVKDEIMSGKKVDDLCLENPVLYHQYGRTLNKIEDLRMRKQFRTNMTIGIWYFGKTGVGKSHKAFTDFDPEKCYNVPDDNGWWDGYTQQETVIFNDFRGEIKYNTMLNLIDKWPFSVKRRNREPIPFVSSKVIITSSLPPWEVYCRRLNEDSIEQLLRRIKVFQVCTDTCTEVVGGNISPDLELRSFEDWINKKDRDKQRLTRKNILNIST